MYATAIQVDAPWHLDILDQRLHSAFDTQYSTFREGAGVDIYILDTGTVYGIYAKI